MEAPTNPENFEDFKNRVAETFKKEGFSQALSEEIERWYIKRYVETGQSGGSIEQRVLFQIELSQIYIVTERDGKAFETLGDAWDEANNAGLTELVEKITELMNSIP